MPVRPGAAHGRGVTVFQAAAALAALGRRDRAMSAAGLRRTRRRKSGGYDVGMRPALAAVLMSALLAAPAGAATVYLRDGRRVTGTVVSATARDLELFTGSSTTRIPVSDISRVDYGEDAPPPAPPAPAPAPAPAPSRPASRDLLWKEDRAQQLGIDLGLSIPTGDVDFSGAGGGTASNGDVSVSAGGHYLYFPRPRLGWGASVEYLSRGPTVSPGLLPAADSTVSGGSVALLGILKLILAPSETVQPYVLAGLGAARSWTVVDSQPRPGFVWSDTGTDEARRLVDGRAWTPAGTLRLGLDFWPSSPGVFGIEAGWTAVGAATHQATNEGRALGVQGVSGPLNIITIGGRWGWRF
jgi:hypothetical protein